MCLTGGRGCVIIKIGYIGFDHYYQVAIEGGNEMFSNNPYKYDANWTKNEIRVRKDEFLGFFILCLVLNIACLVGVFVGKPILLVFVVCLSIGCLFIVLDFVNTKMLYDDKGITFVSALNQKTFYTWDLIVSVEDTFEDARLCGSRPGRILKIGCRNSKGKIEYMKYYFGSYVGIVRFLHLYSEYYSAV